MINASRKSIIINALSILVLILIAYSWLIFPYAIQGDDLLFETGEQVRNERFQNFTTLSRILTREITLPGGTTVSALYVSDEYIRYVGSGGDTGIYHPDSGIVFLLDEEQNDGELPGGVPETLLLVDGNEYRPVSVEAPDNATHHRRSVITYAKYDDNGQPVIKQESPELVLSLVKPAQRYIKAGLPAAITESSLSWKLPMDVPDDMKSSRALNQAMLFSLAAGLLSSMLTPCLMQLVLFLVATLAGLSAKELIQTGNISQAVQKRIMWKIILFLLVFIMMFILTGALIGYTGREARIFFTDYSGSTSGLAGAVIILFGLWLGIKTRLPLICRLPGAAMVENFKSRGILGLVFVAIALSVGCMSCYTGYIMGSLIIYIGTLDNAFNGAVLMGSFAAGVTIPFLVAAISFSRMRNLLVLINRHTRLIGAVSSIIILIFGLFLATNSYHEVSDLFYPYLGLD